MNRKTLTLNKHRIKPSFLDGFDNVYVTSDWHFNHANILKFEADRRPFETVEEMNQYMIDHWNNVVSSNDIIIHVGDFSYGKNISSDQMTKLVSALNGHKIFITGNHDHDLLKIPRVKYSELNIERIVNKMETTYGGTHVTFNHYPEVTWLNKRYGSVLLYGHLHSVSILIKHAVNVGYDANGRILALSEAIQLAQQNTYNDGFERFY